MAASRFDLAVLAIGIVAISSAAVLIREAEAPTLAIGAYRLGLASLPLGLYAAASGRLRRPAPGREDALTALAALCLALHIAFWVASLKETSVVTSVVIVASQPLFVAVAARPLLGERPEPAVWAGILVASAGAAIMVAEDLGEGGGAPLGDLYALIGAVLAAAYILVGRSLRSRGSDWLPYATTAYAGAALILLAGVGVSGAALGGLSNETYLFLVLIALLPQLVGHTAINRSLGYLPAATIAVAILGEPVGATVLAAIFLGETPSAFEAAGALLVLAGIYLGLRPARAPPVLQ